MRPNQAPATSSLIRRPTPTGRDYTRPWAICAPTPRCHCTGEPELIATTFVGGLEHLPIRYSLRWPCSMRAERSGIRRRLRACIRGKRHLARDGRGPGNRRRGFTTRRTLLPRAGAEAGGFSCPRGASWPTSAKTPSSRLCTLRPWWWQWSLPLPHSWSACGPPGRDGRQLCLARRILAGWRNSGQPMPSSAPA